MDLVDNVEYYTESNSIFDNTVFIVFKQYPLMKEEDEILGARNNQVPIMIPVQRFLLVYAANTNRYSEIFTRSKGKICPGRRESSRGVSNAYSRTRNA